VRYINYVGLYIHKAFCHATITAEYGTIIKSRKFETNEEERQKFSSAISEAQIVIKDSEMWESHYELLDR
jgi:hypothetical protein